MSKYPEIKVIQKNKPNVEILAKAINDLYKEYGKLKKDSESSPKTR